MAYYVKKNNPFYKKQEIHKLEAEKTLFSTKLNNRFNANVSFNYGVNQYAETLANAYQHLNVRQSISVGLQIPVFQWGINKNKIRIAQNTYQVACLYIDKKVLEFENELTEKINLYNFSVKQWFTTERVY